ncbi:hypothetical protein MJN54_29960, partial [Salmonella enterica subsp. enterica serovar Kentucky]|nr:hypothetical protein [Salmonella enterica subsp. enterica serovar Kentucky]
LQRAFPHPPMRLREREQVAWLSQTMARELDMDPDLLRFDFQEDWEDLQYEPLILMKKDSWHRKTIIEECTKRGIHTHIFLSSNR